MRLGNAARDNHQRPSNISFSSPNSTASQSTNPPAYVLSYAKRLTREKKGCKSWILSIDFIEPSNGRRDTGSATDTLELDVAG
jgi:hypothetical protein